MRLVFTMFTLFSVLAGFSEAQAKDIFQAAAEEFYSQKANVQTAQQCEPKQGSDKACTEFICGEKFRCGYEGMLLAVRACQGNYGKVCVSYICDEKFRCTFDGALKAAAACRGNVDISCLSYVCGEKFNCTFGGILKAAQSCGGTGEEN